MSENVPPLSSRRDFLQGRAALKAIEHAVDSLAPGETAPAPGTSAHFLCEIGRAAMACEFAVYVDARRHPRGPEVALAALDVIDTLEAQLSVYRPESEVSRLNARAARESIPVERRLFELLELAQTLHEMTGGAFDIATGQLTKAWGFYRRQGIVPEPAVLAAALAASGSRQVELDAASRGVRFRSSGVELNLGAIGKGYALDRAAQHLLDAGIGDFIFHGGASSVVARGTHAAQEPHEPGWLVGVKHPLRPEKRLGEIRLHNEALGTSGTGAQFFQHQGKRFGHILDPRTGHPASGLLSVTVIAPSAALADALSTALFVLGFEQAVAWLNSHTRWPLAAVFVLPGGHAGAVNVQTWGLRGDCWQVLA